MSKKAAILLFLGVFYLRVYFVASLNWSSIDESSLLALKVQINSNILSKNWSQETSFCTWIGVICSQRHPRVIGLNLSNMGLRGTIAREIGNLSFMTFLDVSNNNISGLIPGEIGNLMRLRVLNLALNQLSDQIPESLGSLRKLEGLNLSNNYLSRDIPRSLSTCVELKIFDISYNNVTGNIPMALGNLSQLQELILWHNGLTGELPSTIFNISSLLTIDVSENQMSGSIPKDICTRHATELESLWLYQNQFEGEIPSTLTHCHSLKILSMMGNKFTGIIPSEFGNLSVIQMVGLGGNRLTGVIPPSISNLSNLVLLDVGENSFHGTVPSEIGQLSSLTRLNLQGNKLNGEVPQSLFNLSRLQMLSISANNVSGSLPFSIDRGLSNIEYLILGANQFHGKIPNSVSNLSRLIILDLSNNSFTGDIPVTIGKLSQLETLSLENNQLTNNVSIPEQDFISSLTSCKHLNVLKIESNPITGVLPKSLGSGNLSGSLQNFVAHSCRFIGPLPAEVGNLSNLLWLNLGYNDLTGAIPVTLGNLGNLQKLEIYGNKLQGSIFHVLCKLKNLYSVDLRENSFYGQLPRCLGNLSMLREINLADNAFNSSIPPTLWFNEHVERISLSNNLFYGSLSREIGDLKSLRELDLSGNQISGDIPSAISELQSLIRLSLSNNKLVGPIDESFVDLKDLQYLDLSCNILSGPIPKSLEALVYLTYLNVSFNQLSGKIPDGGPFVNFTAEFFTGNKGLCGAPRFKVEACKSNMQTPSSKNKLLKYILPAIAIIFLAALFLIFVQRNRCKKLSSSSFSDLPRGLIHERISYHEVLYATNNLDEQNLIGSGSFGSVYKGEFSDAMVAAIKVFNLDVQGALKSFDTECEMMRNIRHRNLIKIITSCSNLNFKALVMAHMPNGNLEKWLYSPNYSVNIFQRLEIMIDVACAIEYLHDGFIFPIAHCDLKPQNILLDRDMVAHVGDFGIAKLLTQEQRIQHTKTLGTIGYMAPEYGSDGIISTMVDVYSYGILMMEILSRRKPTDEMFSGELTMKTWVSKSFPNLVMQIVDNELLNMNDESTRGRRESCLTSIIELALVCTADLPEKGPNMKDVLVMIKKIKLDLSNSNN